MISHLKIYAGWQIIPCLKNQVSLISHLNKQNLVRSFLWLMKETFFCFYFWCSGPLESWKQRPGAQRSGGCIIIWEGSIASVN